MGFKVRILGFISYLLMCRFW